MPMWNVDEPALFTTHSIQDYSQFFQLIFTNIPNTNQKIEAFGMQTKETRKKKDKNNKYYHSPT